LSEQDREKWNSRYAAGAYAERREPSAIVLRALALTEPIPGRALDVACGAGRNALHLAACGFTVDAMDISSEALQRARESARLRRLEVHWLERDLSQPLELPAEYQLIVMVRYVNATLLGQLVRALAPGGVLVVEQHLRTDAQVIGPRSPEFRVEPGALVGAVQELELVEALEGLTTDPDGRTVALASVIARRDD